MRKGICFLALLLMLCGILALSFACKSPENSSDSIISNSLQSESSSDSAKDSGHTHSFTVKKAQKKYLKSAATCTEKAVYFYSCSCGAVGTTTFEYGKTIAHTYDQQVAKDKYLKSVATCTKKAVYFYSCSCSAVGTTTFEYGETIAHPTERGWSYNQTHHWHNSTCSCNVKVDYSEHTPDGSGWCSVCQQAVLPTDGVLYDVSEDGTYAEVIAYFGKYSKVKISDIYNNLPVRNICNEVFTNTSITEVLIPDSVTSIGNSVFSRCDRLTSVTIGNSVRSMGDYVFYNCDRLTSVTIGNSVTSIGDYAFYNCDKLTSVTIGNSVTSIGMLAFSDCSGLTNITIPDSVTSIGWAAFYNCDRLTSVTIGNSVTSIGGWAFRDCSRLTSITIPGSVRSIGDAAFAGCGSLKNIYIKNIAAWCKISGLDGLMRYGPDNKNLYLNGEEVTNLIIPDSVTSIGDYAFYNWSGLTNITIPDSVTYIGIAAFSGSRNLQYNVYGRTKYLGNANNPYHVLITTVGNKDFSSYQIHNETKIICSYAFAEHSRLTNITIPDSVTCIGYSAFSHCNRLTSITIPDSVTYIGGEAFFCCYKLVEVINKSSLPIKKGSESYGQIGYRALNVKTNGTSDIINNDDYLFYTYNNENYLLGYIGNDIDLALPKNYNGQNYKIYNSAFRDCSGLTSITIPDSVTSIGDYAFDGCSGLTNITIPDSVTSIGDLAFFGCSGLTSITIPDSVTSIGGSTFSGCSSLTSITIPDSVTSIKYAAFNNCIELKTVYYKGTAEQWSKISIDNYSNYNDYLTTKSTIYYYSETKPTKAGKYWHYDKNGNIIEW